MYIRFANSALSHGCVMLCTSNFHNNLVQHRAPIKPTTRAETTITIKPYIVRMATVYLASVYFTYHKAISYGRIDSCAEKLPLNRQTNPPTPSPNPVNTKSRLVAWPSDDAAAMMKLWVRYFDTQCASSSCRKPFVYDRSVVRTHLREITR